LVEALAMIVGTELAEQVSKVPATEDHEVIEALGPDCFCEPFGMWVAVWAACGDPHALHAFGLEQVSSRLREHGVAIVMR
jgi:hypothetical protein